MNPRRLLPLLALLVLVPVDTAFAATRTETVSKNETIAILSYDATKNEFGREEFKDLALRIAVDGDVKRQGALTGKCRTACSPANFFQKKPSIHLSNLDSDADNEVLLDLYTGGAHCCAIAKVYDYQASSGTYRLTDYDFSDPGYRIRHLRGASRLPQFITGDPRFNSLFTSFAGTAFPIMIYELRGGRFTNVTKAFRAEILKSSARHYRLYRQARNDSERELQGIIAAFVAEDYLAGQGAVARARLNAARARGEITSAYITQLNRYLRRYGYR